MFGIKARHKTIIGSGVLGLAFILIGCGGSATNAPTPSAAQPLILPSAIATPSPAQPSPATMATTETNQTKPPKHVVLPDTKQSTDRTSSLPIQPLAIGQTGRLIAASPTAKINLRIEPSSNVPTQRYGLVGDRVLIQDIIVDRNQYTWYKVQFQGSQVMGWIRGDFVSPLGRAVIAEDEPLEGDEPLEILDGENSPPETMSHETYPLETVTVPNPEPSNIPSNTFILPWADSLTTGRMVETRSPSPTPLPRTTGIHSPYPSSSDSHTSPSSYSSGSGNCDYSWQVDSAGRSCGGRAADVRPGGSGRSSSPSYSVPSVGSGSTYVRPYTRRDGTHVRGHYRRR